MRKDFLAEWILSFVMTQDRATAVVGDLIEKLPNFWMSISDVFAVSLISNFAVSPGQIIGRGTLGFLLQFFAPVLVTFPFSTVAFFWSVDHQAVWLWTSCLLFVTAMTQFWLGFSLEKLSRGYLGAVCLAVAISNSAAGLLGLNMVSVHMVFWLIPLVVGAMVAHTRGTKAAKLVQKRATD